MTDKLKLEQIEQTIGNLKTELSDASDADEFIKAAEIKEKILQLEEEHETLLQKLRTADVQLEIEANNLVRAVLLTQRYRCDENNIRNIQESAVKQYAFDYRNAQGLNRLIKEWELSKDDVIKILKEGLSEFTGYTGLQYDINTLSHITLTHFIEYFLKSNW